MTKTPSVDQSVKTTIIGVISDTHGLLRPEARKALVGVDMILHAGDFDTMDILTHLSGIAPLTGVRGNMDRGGWAARLPQSDYIQNGNHGIYLLHDLNRLDVDPAAADIRIVITGHTHQAAIKNVDRVLYFNPGGAGHRRFNYPITLGKIVINNETITPEIITLIP
ncbi:MAG: metallophosphoesterase family protein [Desulfobacteraceae bacterium]|nr:metallophosphoesterase family protein [Desulfobacteraceae bacterium]